MNVLGVNIAPNREWWVRLSDSGFGVSVGLYATEAAALGSSSRVASGSSSGYGEGLEIVLANDGAEVVTGTWSALDSWHLLVSGEEGEDAAVFRLPAGIEMEAVEHPAYAAGDLAGRRALAEINAATHLARRLSVPLGSHIPTAEVGETPRLDSARFGGSVYAQVQSLTISGSVGDDRAAQLTTSLELVRYQRVRR